MQETRPGFTDFERVRKSYRPRSLRLLMIAESPPASNGFFYNPQTIGKDHLFRETMKSLGLWPRNLPMPKGINKTGMLRRFRAMGFYLVDTCRSPVNMLDRRKRREAVLDGVLRLVDDVRRLDPPHIVIIKASIFEPVRTALIASGLGSHILNTGPIPFPSHGNQQEYRTVVKRLLTKIGLL